jgi:hypothetical protein
MVYPSFLLNPSPGNAAFCPKWWNRTGRQIEIRAVGPLGRWATGGAVWEVNLLGDSNMRWEKIGKFPAKIIW